MSVSWIYIFVVSLHSKLLEILELISFSAIATPFSVPIFWKKIPVKAFAVKQPYIHNIKQLSHLFAVTENGRQS